ncbi:hypothetical protein BBR01nite_23070 [Brevibacillus brevis]|nr:hypothetical protein BBR01nite_23070 [Brevibacillus brevis]
MARHGKRLGEQRNSGAAPYLIERQQDQLSCGAMFTAPWEFFVAGKSDYCEKYISRMKRDSK